MAYTYSWSNGATTEDVGNLSVGTYSVTVTDANGCSTTSSFTLTEPAILASSGVAATYACGTNVSCNGASDGSIDLTATGGASCLAYSYSWSNGATTEDVSNLAAGTYSVTVTDANGCSTTSSFTLTEPDQLRVDAITSPTFVCGTNVSCNGASDGAINLAIGGGATCLAYTYQWSDGATTEDRTGLTAGTYSVTVTDANGCSTSGSITLTEPAILASSGVAATYSCGTNVSCNGAADGSINLTATGGAGCVNYSYSWSNGATTEDVSGLTAGTYTVTVTDANGCSTTSSFTLTEPAILASSGVAATYACGTNISCNGSADGSINLSVTGGASCAAYSYSWSNGATTEDIGGLTAGTYTVTVTDANGCSTTSSFTLTQPAVLQRTLLVSATHACGYNISCNGASDGTVNLEVGGGASCVAYTYQWSNGATTQDLSGLTAGTYTVTVTDANGCSFTDAITLTQPAPVALSLTAFTYTCGYNVSCNGASNGIVGLTVTGGASCLAYTYQWSDGATTEDRTGLAAGTYGVTVTDANGCSATASITLTQPAPLAVTSLTSPLHLGYNISCNGGNDGAITVAYTGGATCQPRTVALSGPVSGSQSGNGTNTFTGLVAGTYTVTVTDANGCTVSSTITLTQPTPVVSNAGPDQCILYGYTSGNCATLTGTQSGGVGPYTVRWNVGSSSGTLVGTTATVTVCPSVTTTYCFTVTDANGCSTTDCMVVNATDIRCGNNLQKITICHIPPGNGGNPQTLCVAANAVSQHVPGHSGDYLGACNAQSPCQSQKSGNDQGSSAAAATEAGEAELAAFPNPFSTATTVRFSLPDDGAAELRVYNMTGEEVAVLFDGIAEAGRSYEVEFKAQGLSQGIYFAKLVTAKGEVMTRKLVMNK
ncbi:MAG: T9SS type A sorting domain-containing protein [Bacteroidia bacterium]